RLVLVCACPAILTCAAPRALARRRAGDRPQAPPGGPTPVQEPNKGNKDDDHDRAGDIRYAGYVHVPRFEPPPPETRVSPAKSFNAPPAAEIHPPFRGSGIAGKAGGGVLAAIGAAIAGAFRAVFGRGRKKDIRSRGPRDGRNG